MNALRVACLCLLAGCGYTVGTLAPDGVRTLALEFVDDHSDRRDLDFALTQALATELAARGLRLVLSGDADATCHVRIHAVRQRATAEDANDTVLQGAVTLEADVVLRGRDGRVVLERRGLRETDTFLTASGEDEAIAGDRAARVLARRIAEALSPGF